MATCQRNISQHDCWAQHVACVWPPCYDVLQHVGCCLLKFETGQNCCDLLCSNGAIVWPELATTGPTMLGYVALRCCYRLAGA